MGGLNISFPTQQKGGLPELTYSLASLSELFELGLPLGSEMEPEEVRTHILTSMRRAVRAQGACLLLYYKVQERLVPVASQGEKFPCGSLASMMDADEIVRFSRRAPGLALSSVELEGIDILLVSLVYGDVFIGLVALTVAGTNSLLEERSVLLTYMGKVAAQILYTNDLRSNELRSAVAQERNRIARDLHDGVVQQLAYALYKLELIQHLLESDSPQMIMAEIERISTILHESLQDLRSTTTSLLPSQLSMHTFSDALASLLQDFQLDNPAVSLEQHISVLPPLPARLEAATFRVTQEALNNIRKHAMATRVTLYIQLQPEVLRFEIHDNGRGFDTRSVQNMLDAHEEGIVHSGLRGMYQRVQEVAGTWQISSKPGVGTTIVATFPLLHSALELTQREREVLQLIVAGLDNHAIARKLSIRSETVKKHVQHITQKLHVKDRSQATVIASKQNLHPLS